MLKAQSRSILVALTLLAFTGAPALAQSPKQPEPKASQTDAEKGAEHPGDMAMGKKDAAITVIEYASLSCPHCADFALNEFPAFKKEYVDTGKVRYIYRQFPTPPENLAVGAEAIARCKGDAKDYFDMLHTLYATQMVWESAQNPLEILRQIANTHGIDFAQFDKCVADPKVTERVEKETQYAYKTWHIEYTPSFVINGKYYPDLHTLTGLQKILDPMIAGKAAK